MAEENTNNSGGGLTGFLDVFLSKLKEQTFVIVLMLGVIYFQNRMFVERIETHKATIEKQEDYILNYFMQATAYCEMFEELTGKEINQIVLVFGLVEGGSQIVIKQKHDYLKPLNEYVDYYWSGINEEVA